MKHRFKAERGSMSGASVPRKSLENYVAVVKTGPKMKSTGRS